MPLIHGSTTPSAKEVATAASIASPPAASTSAPTCAARLCCAATTPPRVATTRLRTIWVSEKLSVKGAFNLAKQLRTCPRICFGVARDVRVRREPHALVTADVAHELVEDPDARAIADDVRMHGELEDAAFAIRGVELSLEDVEHVRGRRVGPQRREAVHVEVHGIIADPLHRQLDDPGVLSVHEELVAVDIRHERRV